jgi:RHS repeat-associated protein
MEMPGRSLNPSDYRFAYQGLYAEADAETGLSSFWLRSYDARIGQFTTTDPFGQGFSSYAGMGNNPVSLVDPTGGITTYARSWADGMAQEFVNTMSKLINASYYEGNYALGFTPGGGSVGGGAGGGGYWGCSAAYDLGLQLELLQAQSLAKHEELERIKAQDMLENALRKLQKEIENLQMINGMNDMIAAVNNMGNGYGMSIGPGGDETALTAFNLVMGYFLGYGDIVSIYGPDSKESQEMMKSFGVYLAIKNYNESRITEGDYKFSPQINKKWEITNIQQSIFYHMYESQSALRFVTGGYNYSLADKGDRFDILIINQMSANSLLYHIGDFFDFNANFINPGQPGSTQTQIYYLQIPK